MAAGFFLGGGVGEGGGAGMPPPLDFFAPPLESVDY